MTPLTAARTSLYTSIRSDATLLGLLGDSQGVYTELIPDTAVLPAVLITFMQGSDYDTQGARGLSIFPVMIQCNTADHNHDSAAVIMERVDLAVHNVVVEQGSPGSGYRVRAIRVSEGASYQYNNGKTFYVHQMMYNLFVQPR
jgi:hypothetical protein